VEDFVSSALRHARDAEHLLEPGAHISPDQAWHLAGFAHECARKTCLATSWVAKVLGHDFDNAGETILEIAAALDPRVSRYPVRDWRTRYPRIPEWSPNHRYERTGSRPASPSVRELVTQARAAVDTMVMALYLDGRVSPESLQT
jgi:hypothetical protein